MIALVDCNSFYASCEQIFRPDLRGKPVIVLSNNDGCIIALTKEAKALNLPNFSPFFKLKPDLEKYNVAVFSANFEFYGDISNRVVEALQAESGVPIEPYSIDEMFLDFSGIQNLREFSGDIKKVVWKQIKIPVCLGVGPTKTIAKLANKIAKNVSQTQGVCILESQAKRDYWYKTINVEHVWGVGRRLAKHLKQMGITTIEDLLKFNQKSLRKRFSVVIERTICELKGEACLSFETQRAIRKKIYVTRSFGKKTDSLNELLLHTSSYAAAAAEKLRAEQLKVKQIRVFIMTRRFNEDFYKGQEVIELSYFSNDTRDIIAAAKSMVKKLYKPGLQYARCGVGLTELKDDRVKQFDFFSLEQNIKSEKCMQVMDAINQRFGRNLCQSGSERIGSKWSMNRNYLSPKYTTQWQDIPLIKT